MGSGWGPRGFVYILKYDRQNGTAVRNMSERGLRREGSR